MSDTPKTERSIDAEVEVTFDRADLLVLSDGQEYEEELVVEADDGTIVNLTMTYAGQSAKGV